MRELDTCLELARKIKGKDEIICEKQYRMLAPKNQIITDMPKGGGVVNAMDDYLIWVEKLNRAKERLQNKLDTEWDNAKNILKNHGVTKDETIELMRLRFYCGLPWKKCAAKMQELYPDSKWNTNKCFRTYRAVLHKTSVKNL